MTTYNMIRKIVTCTKVSQRKVNWIYLGLPLEEPITHAIMIMAVIIFSVDFVFFIPTILDNELHKPLNQWTLCQMITYPVLWNTKFTATPKIALALVRSSMILCVCSGSISNLGWNECIGFKKPKWSNPINNEKWHLVHFVTGFNVVIYRDILTPISPLLFFQLWLYEIFLYVSFFLFLDSR